MAASFLDMLGSEDDNLNKSLLSLLECPVCSQYMAPPIRQCSDGHNICSKCLQNHAVCHICKKNFIETRNISLEKIAETLDFPCPNYHHGCKTKHKISALVLHQQSCKYSTHQCKASKTCKFVSVSQLLLKHVCAMHEGSLMIGDSKELKVSKIESSGNVTSVFLISALEELFWFHYKLEGKSGKFMGAVQYVGANENAKKYRYEITMSSDEPDFARFIYSRVAHNENEDINQIFQMDRCFSVTTRMVQQFYRKDKTLRFRVKVEKCS